MAHPAGNHLRNDKVQHARVADITAACGGGMAKGGAAHSDEAEDKSLVRKMVKKAALRATGGAVKARSDRPSRARGGRLGKKKSGHTVNVIVGHPPTPPMPPMVPGVAAGPPPGGVPGAAPPMPPKPMMPPSPGLGGPPPGLGVPPGGPPLPLQGMRYAGGRNRKTGGKVEAGSTPSKSAFTTKGKAFDGSKGNLENADTAGIGKGRTAVQHARGKQDGANIGRGPVITKATGGPITSKYAFKSDMAPTTGTGAGGGKSRLDKANHPEKYTA